MSRQRYIRMNISIAACDALPVYTTALRRDESRYIPTDITSGMRDLRLN
jgi:hypothetical protein